jgi:hypothetical protein
MPVVARAKTARITEENFMVRYEIIVCNEKGGREGGIFGLLYRTSPINCTRVSKNQGSHSWSCPRSLVLKNVVTPFTYHELEGVAYPRQLRFLHVL